MAHESILPALRALLAADGAAPDFADAVSALVAADSGSTMVPIPDAARAMGLSKRTVWLRIQRRNLSTVPRRGRRGSMVCLRELMEGAS